jgi:hypothetical protein
LKEIAEKDFKTDLQLRHATSSKYSLPKGLTTWLLTESNRRSDENHFTRFLIGPPLEMNIMR